MESAADKMEKLRQAAFPKPRISDDSKSVICDGCEKRLVDGEDEYQLIVFKRGGEKNARCYCDTCGLLFPRYRVQCYHCDSLIPDGTWPVPMKIELGGTGSTIVLCCSRVCNKAYTAVMREDGDVNYRCRICQKTGETMKKCSQCKTARYCSTECQKADWKQHKPICETLSS